MIVIAGTGRSGTSFLARLCLELDRNIGTGPRVGMIRSGNGALAGGEDVGFVRLNRALFNRAKEIGPEKLREFAKKRDVVKDPYFCYVAGHWFAAKAVESVIVANRDFEQSAKSALASGLAVAPPGQRARRTSFEELVERFKDRHMQLMRAISYHKARHVEVSFPASVKDVAYLYRVLAMTLDVDRPTFEAAWRRAVDPEYKPTQR